jgi:hypothetical protein
VARSPDVAVATSAAFGVLPRGPAGHQRGTPVRSVAHDGGLCRKSRITTPVWGAERLAVTVLAFCTNMVNSGTGHTWKLIGDDPWRRAYVVYQTELTLAPSQQTRRGKSEHRRIGEPGRGHHERHAR